ENGEIIAKPRSSYNDEDRKSVQLNAKVKHIIICAINSRDFNRVLISMLVHEYEMFTMNENEDIKSMFTRF
ncbi:hypothetical protein CFOL_v3_12284, partial [Cephalotus follicularis]